jgi:hypothetical protein
LSQKTERNLGAEAGRIIKMSQKLSGIGKQKSLRDMANLRYYPRQKGFFSGTSGMLFKIGFFFIAMLILIGIVALVFPSVTSGINAVIYKIDQLIGSL